jgi:hypothetical protein
MQSCKPFVGTLCSLTRPFVAVFVLQLIALRWGWASHSHRRFTCKRWRLRSALWA